MSVDNMLSVAQTIGSFCIITIVFVILFIAASRDIIEFSFLSILTGIFYFLLLGLGIVIIYYAQNLENSDDFENDDELQSLVHWLKFVGAMFIIFFLLYVAMVLRLTYLIIYDVAAEQTPTTPKPKPRQNRNQNTGTTTVPKTYKTRNRTYGYVDDTDEYNKAFFGASKSKQRTKK